MVFDHNCLILSTPRVLFCAGSIPFVQHSPAIVLVPADVQTRSGYRTQYLIPLEWPLERKKSLECEYRGKIRLAV